MNFYKSTIRHQERSNLLREELELFSSSWEERRSRKSLIWVIIEGLYHNVTREENLLIVERLGILREFRTETYDNEKS